MGKEMIVHHYQSLKIVKMTIKPFKNLEECIASIYMDLINPIQKRADRILNVNESLENREFK